jgi:hypothetical protein
VPIRPVTSEIHIGPAVSPPKLGTAERKRVDAAHAFGGWLAILTAWCDHHDIAYQGVQVGTIKRHVTGQRRQGGGHRRNPRARVQPCR